MRLPRLVSTMAKVSSVGTHEHLPPALRQKLPQVTSLSSGYGWGSFSF